MSGGLVGTNKKPRAKVATRDITRGVPSRHWTAPPISGSRHFGHFVFGCGLANFQGLAPAELVWPKTSQKRAPTPSGLLTIALNSSTQKEALHQGCLNPAR